VAELHAGDLSFFKANHVADTLEFDKPLHSRTLYPIYVTHPPFWRGRVWYAHEELKEMAWER
jgi:hypothetical protein